MDKIIKRQKDLSMFVDNEIFICQSMLVDEALKQEIFSWDDVENLYRPFDGKQVSPSVCTICHKKATLLDSETGACQECYNDTVEPQEIYEWWLVSHWMAEKLRERGEPVLQNDFGTWWGRCCTGQAIYMDGVIEHIYDELMND